MTSQHKKYDSFLNVQNSLELPSNLLSLKRRGLEIEEQEVPKTITTFNQTHQRYFNSVEPEQPTYVEERKKNKSVLYKRLTGIRGENRELEKLSFSKMLSRMIVMDESDQQYPANPYDNKKKHSSMLKPILQKQYKLNCDDEQSSRAVSRSIDGTEKVTRNIFKKYYMPHSQTIQTAYLQTANPDDKYIYKNGKRVECKRIHNFYTSNMFRRSFNKCVRKTTQGFHRSPK